MVFGIFYDEKHEFDTKKMQFTGKTYLDEALGSDAYFILDGRNRIATWVKDMRQRFEKIRKCHPHYRGFKIMRGDILHARPISELIMIEAA